MNLRTFTLGALLLLAASGLGFAGERARGNLVEHQGKLYVLQPANSTALSSSGTFASGKSSEVFREMVTGAKAHADLWSKVEAIYELTGTPEELAALKELELRWIDVEGTASATTDELSEDPQKRKIKTLAIEDLHNPSLMSTSQTLRRTWEWESSVSGVGSQTWTFRHDLTFGGAKLMGPARADLENYMPSLITPPVSTVSTPPAIRNGVLHGPKVRIQAYVHYAPSGRHVVALQALQSIADVSGGTGMTPVSAPSAGLPLPKLGLPAPAPVVPGPGGTPAPVVPGSSGPVVVSGPGAASPLTPSGPTVMGPGAATPLKPLGAPGTSGTPAAPAAPPMSNPALTPVTSPAATPAAPVGPSVAPLTKKTGIVTAINP